MPRVKQIKRRKRAAKQPTVCPKPRPMSVPDIYRLYPDDMSIVTLFQACGIIPRSKDCQRGHKMILDGTAQDRKPRWRCRLCPKDVEGAVLSGTLFEGTHLELRKLLLAIYYWGSDCSQTQISYFTGIADFGCVAKIRDELRSVCADVNNSSRPLFGTWYIDETLIHKSVVLGGLEQRTGKCFAHVVPDRSAEVMLPVIKRYVGRGSLIHTDGHASYKALEGYDRRNWKHLVVKHRRKVYVDPVTGACTNTVEGWWRVIKDLFRDKRDLSGFLSEQVFKRNARPIDPFTAILSAIGKYRPPSG